MGSCLEGGGRYALAGSQFTGGGGIKNPRVVLIGLGRLGQEILTRISREFEITCLTPEPEAADILVGIKREDVELVVGDATSRLVLESCRIEDADTVIITITTERISREVARVIKENFKPRRVISVAVTEDTTQMLKEMGFEVDNIFASTATDIRNRIGHKTKTPHAIGIGKEEILEVEVHPNSRMANKPLGFVKPIKWRVGIIYREGNIVIPRVDTVLKPRDRVVILGEPQVLRTVAETLTFNYQKFPLDYGSSLIVYLCGLEDEGFINELNYIYSVFPLRKVWIIRSPRVAADKFDSIMEKLEIKKPMVKATSLSSLGAIKDAVSDCGETQGLTMISSQFLDSYYSTFFGMRKKAYLRNFLSITHCPVLISQGTAPYERMAVPCVGNLDIENALETALQISEDLSNTVTSIMVSPSKYIAAPDESDIFAHAKKLSSSMALTYKSRIETMELTGNPIKSVLGNLDKEDLIIASMDSRQQESATMNIFKPDVIWNIIRSSPVSTLVLPEWGETL